MATHSPLPISPDASTAGHMETHIGMTTMYQGANSDSDDEIEISRESITNTHTMTSYTAAFNSTDDSGEAVDGNPKHWEWEHVQQWLKQKGMADMIKVFAEGATEKDGTDGDELLAITLEKLTDESGAYKVIEKLDIKTDDIESVPIIERFFRELTKLQLKANESTSADFHEHDTR